MTIWFSPIIYEIKIDRQGGSSRCQITVLNERRMRPPLVCRQG